MITYYLTLLKDEIALLKEVSGNFLLLAICISLQEVKDMDYTTDYTSIIDLFLRIEGNMIILSDTLLFLDNEVTTIHNKLNS